MSNIQKQSTAGFSLIETLVALLIVLMVSMTVAAGIPAAQEAYFNVMKAANAQLLLSTTLTELRDELSIARDVKVEKNVGEPPAIKISYKTSLSKSNCISCTQTNGIMIEKRNEVVISEKEPEGSTSYERLLVSEFASNKDLIIMFGDCEKNGNWIKLKHIKVIDKNSNNGNPLAELDEYGIKLIAELR